MESTGTLRVICSICPRECSLSENSVGFCGVRKNVNGTITSLNYNKAVAMGIETIETEAIFHYAPGTKILAVGNLGCNLTCDFCQNWKTSQSRLAEDSDIFTVTPQTVVDYAKNFNLDMISWTYNEPVVWHEFVLDASRLARSKGIKTLYKSSFYITKHAVNELIPVIDLFSISIKSLNPEFYKRLTGGELAPVLEATKLVFESGRHLEISNLLIPGENTSKDDIKAIADWIVTELSPDVPLHFVRFHPDYKYTDSVRTPPEMLVEAREIALARGVKHVYLGNVSGMEGSDTLCESCNAVLVKRYATKASIEYLDDNSNCTKCKTPSPIKCEARSTKRDAISIDHGDENTKEHFWRGEIQAIHIDIKNPGLKETMLSWRHINGSLSKSDSLVIPPDRSVRVLVSKASEEESGVIINYADTCEVGIYEVFDRAHLPTVSVSEASSNSDMIPMPFFNEAEFEVPE